ncbi:SDR family NAD(P)-dependent oxidoreductase [Lentibacter algarum]|uniref:SDR family NAD(P)-dependent oxidoreductase n=1 Tax=Lentibacter algarum TaxID=576131 RepID=UPI001C078B25|nr:SDR family NAD(P)-dependent oxidoreductase [Lentibacter algarum]MBU2981413.1 SDR family NAD(P)-dependent oxidoreductase [Lentibacter algarum]
MTSAPKTALITGAGGGVGLALAKALAAEGYSLILTDRDEAQLQATATEVVGKPELITADLRSEVDLAALSQRIESTEQPVDLLVNNAGIIMPGSVGSISDDLTRAHVDINMTAPMILCAAAARAMKPRGAGNIVSIVSLAAMAPMKDSAAYAASKFGLRGFMSSLSLEMHPCGVKVSGIYPSAIDTPMLAAELANPAGSPLNFVGNATPMKPEQIAEHVVKALDSGKLETWLPKSDGIMAGIMMLLPGLIAPVAGWFEKQGIKKKDAYLKSLEGDEN